MPPASLASLAAYSYSQFNEKEPRPASPHPDLRWKRRRGSEGPQAICVHCHWLWQVFSPRRTSQTTHPLYPHPRKTYVRPCPFLSVYSHSSSTAFKCTFPLCQKFFNRHDNLLQHLKVHRDVVPTDAERKSASGSAPPSTSAPSPPPRRATASPPTAHHKRTRERSYSPADEPDSEPVVTTNNSSIPRTIYNAFPMPMPSYHHHLHPAHPLHSHLPIHHEHSLYATSLHPTMSSYASTSETMSRITNMAVSSLRTELPHSPSVISDMRGGALQTSPY